jgi:hypothetical protein
MFSAEPSRTTLAMIPIRHLVLEYVRQLPRARPKDLHTTFATGGEQINLCEGEEANIGAYYVRVERIYRRGIPCEFESSGAEASFPTCEDSGGEF